MDQERMLRPALIGGVLLGILSALPVLQAFNCVCCMWVIGGGMLAAHLYVKSSPFAVTLGSGVLLGLFTGVIGAIVDTIFSIPLHFALRGLTVGVAEQLNQVLERVGNLPPETRAAFRSMFAHGAGIGVAVLLFGAFIRLIVYGLFGLLGGAIGVALFEKRKPGSPADSAPIHLPPPAGGVPPSEPPVQL